MIPLNVLYHGSDAPLQTFQELRLGSLTALFDPQSGAVRRLRVGDVEILHGIYGAVRDRNWSTVTPIVHHLKVTSANDSFEVSFEARCQRGDISFVWQGAIDGRTWQDETQAEITQVRFAMNGVACSSFLRNRIGLCVLYPGAECARRRCRVDHVDGSIEDGTFPDLIAPYQPFQRIRAISHQPAPGVDVRVSFEGDVFEMEDQRNWTDASFKTYSTPLELPFPVEVVAGSVMDQTVTMRVRMGSSGKHARTGGADRVLARSRNERRQPVSIVVDWAGPRRCLPHIGLGVASHGEPLEQTEIARLKALRLSHLRVDLDLIESEWKSKLLLAAEQARTLGAALEVAVFFPEQTGEELTVFAREVETVVPDVGAWLIFAFGRRLVSEPFVRIAAERLRTLTPATKIGGGTNANFVELNRQRPGPGLLDLVCYSINPQVHAFDDASLMETLEVQGETVRTARAFAGSIPVAVTPVTLRPRFNAVATGPELETIAGELPRQVDVRQMSLFGAAWTLGSLSRLFEAGVNRVTYYETTGWRGVMETQCGSPLAERFRSLPGSVFPMYHVFADVGEFAGGDTLAAVSSDPRKVAAMALGHRGATLQALGLRRVMLANLTGESQDIRIEMPGARCRLKCLDETNAVDAMQSPEAYRATGEWLAKSGGFVQLELRPYAVACLDIEP